MAEYEITPPPASSANQRYDIVPPGAAGATPPVPQMPTKATTPLGQMWHGFQAPIVGLNLLASQAEGYLPGLVPEQMAKRDLAEAERQKRAYQAASTGSWWELGGNLLNPLNYMPGPVPIRGGGLLAAAGRAAEAGAVSSAVQPDHGAWEVVGGAGAGALGGVVVEPLAKAIAGNTTAGLEKFIKETFTQTVKPTVGGKFTQGQAAVYQNKVRAAIDRIVDEKPNLRLSDDLGNVHTGRLPQTLDEFGQAIDQAKQKVFAEYDALAKRAGQAFGGANMVSLAPVVGELNSVVNSPVIQALSPHVAKMASDMAGRLQQIGRFTTTEAQESIQHLNAQLRQFYNSAPTRELVGATNLDAMVASKLREGLDAAVARATGADYQGLKNTHGALRELETGVIRRAPVVGRQEPGRGLMGRIGDVVGAHDVIRGIVHFEPTAVATGLSMRGFTEWIRHLRNPNRAIRRIFEAAEQARAAPDPARREVAAALRKTVPVASALTYQGMTGQLPP